ncbi:unnamed protein product [Cylindrotheca closterium]|uniref:Uncharacterized protein n=1 Tax=Cylindrotheca closterium TaxID=2856 RepID=A0AAD2FMJ4_9STRA|nr:unnamed protein product [Cylindrotheca closterium]
MINDDASPRPTTKLPKEPPEYYEKYPACQIRVYNMVEVHYEVMESIAKQIPYEYLNLVTTTNNNDNNNHKTKNAQCNPYHLNFEFDAKASGKVRAKSWLADMNDRVAGTSITDNLNVTRTLGPAYLGRSNNRTNWDVVIQVTCGCDAATRDWLITNNNNNNHDNHNVCIHHGKCNWTDSIPNSIQMSPHFERYFVPSSLPIFDLDPAEQDKRDDRIDLCTIGSIWRRNWRLVTPFFENNDDDDSNSTTSTNYEQYYDKIRFRMLGKGGMPYPLRPYKNKTKFQPNQIGDDRKFYAAERACGVILLPIARIKGKNYVNYFKSPPDSTWKLSGTIPPIIAFERPFLVPNEILELYRKELPLHVPHRGFDDLEPNGFAEALSSLLDELLEMK